MSKVKDPLNQTETMGSKILNHGSYRQGHVKFKDFSRTSKNLYYSFQGLRVYETY